MDNTPVKKDPTCQYCRKVTTTKFIRTPTGKRWKCQECIDKRNAAVKGR